jgi:hypothetical protein
MGWLFGGKKDGFDDQDYKAWRVHGAVNNVFGSDRLDRVLEDLAPETCARIRKAARVSDRMQAIIDEDDWEKRYFELKERYQKLNDEYMALQKEYTDLSLDTAKKYMALKRESQGR